MFLHSDPFRACFVDVCKKLKTSRQQPPSPHLTLSHSFPPGNSLRKQRSCENALSDFGPVTWLLWNFSNNMQCFYCQTSLYAAFLSLLTSFTFLLAFLIACATARQAFRFLISNTFPQRCFILFAMLRLRSRQACNGRLSRIV